MIKREDKREVDLLIIAVVTGTRAEYGLFYWLLKAIKAHPAHELKLLVTGTHLSHEFGLTYKEIEADGFQIDEKIEILLSSDTAVATSKSTALAIIGCSEALERIRPDLVVLLGDRFEALAAAQAAMFANIPLVHLHGGESTEGLIDEAVRHAITKMSHVHFTSTEAYRARLIQMGEQPERVFNVGALGVESAMKTELLSRQQLSEWLGFDLSGDYFLVTYHPVTLDLAEQTDGAEALFKALDHYPDIKVLLTFPNADTNGRQLIDLARAYQDKWPGRVCLSKSLGRVRYLSALRAALVVVGNSSSGIIEAPSFGAPTVDIGTRQWGRSRAESVLHASPSFEEISRALGRAIELKRQLPEDHAFTNPYDGGETSAKILEILEQVPLTALLRKRFHEI